MVRTALRACGVALLAVFIVAILRSSGRAPTARPLENSSLADLGPSSGVAPRILSLEVRRFRAGNHSEDLDEIGVTSWESGEDDLIRVLARLDHPAYSYLVAFEPDGQFWLADPPDTTTRPLRRSEIQFSTDSRQRGLHHQGAGMQAWLLVSARNPLPPFDEWAAARLLRWRSVQAEGVWRFDGHRIERLRPGKRRVQRMMFESPRPFAYLYATLGNIPDIDAVEAIAYPVRLRND